MLVMTTIFKYTVPVKATSTRTSYIYIQYSVYFIQGRQMEVVGIQGGQMEVVGIQRGALN